MFQKSSFFVFDAPQQFFSIPELHSNSTPPSTTQFSLEK